MPVYQQALDTESEQAVALEAARFLQECYDAYSNEFLAITRRSKSRFEKREWKEVLDDAVYRIGLYHQHLNLIEPRMRDILAGRVHDYDLWADIKSEYEKAFFDEYHADLAAIFYYSVMRRLYVETGDSIEYSDDEIKRCVKAQVEQDPNRPVRIYPADSPTDLTPELIHRIIKDFGFCAPFKNLREDAVLAAEMLRPELERALGSRRFDRIEMLESSFFRNKAAYLFGRVVSGKMITPLVFVLLNPAEGIVIDSALTEEADLHNVFSSARSNFHTDIIAYREVVEFLESIAPSRPMAFIYTSIGFIHPGKLHLVHELRTHIAQTGEKFQEAEGVRGTVMAVFTLATFLYVFKVIRDLSSKPTFRGRRHVVDQYWRVHSMDRVGRMLDIMTFHNLRFLRSNFDEKLLEELLREAPSSVRVENSHVVFRYLYAVRQVTPLDVYLTDKTLPQEARAAAAVDYGYAIKDLAAAGTFVGDYMPNNFGVNRLGRVFLYDYDELDDIVSWNFRKLPEPPSWAEMVPYEDWLSKGEWDVFPEHDFRIFTVPARESDSFLKYHSDILQPGYWNSVKRELLSGIVPDFYPYPQRKRLRKVEEGKTNSSE